jgi:putative NIF3 family GTP cyclohydrolase 1 type 2
MMITLHAIPDPQAAVSHAVRADDESARETRKPASSELLPSLEELQTFFRERLSTGGSEETSEEIPLLWRPGVQPPPQRLRTIGFALDHRARLGTQTGLDALFLHRPFFLPETVLPEVPVFASHRGFDRCLSIGYNPSLADVFGMTNLTPLHSGGSTDPIGMVGDLKTPLTWYSLRALIAQQYQGTEMIGGTVRDPVTRRIAIAAAMSPELIAEAAAAGARVFITGQYRPSARLAVEANGMMVVAVGHRRAELWGLRRLAQETTAAFPDIETIVIE